MIQGVGSNVGKSVIAAGLCRYFANQGLRVAPFKPQNMSNNAAVTRDGREIGRAQYLQSQACRAEPSVDMNPVLLKPEGERGSQVVLRGKVLTRVRAAEYATLKPTLLPEVLRSYRRLARSHDVIICEGAGSTAEINLRSGDIANMGFARTADVPVILLGDIDRGGVIASVVGSWAVLDHRDRDQIRGFIINKFRGDPALFAEGYRVIEERTEWPGLGILPWLDETALLPAEDSLGLGCSHDRGDRALHIACLTLKRIANFDDLDPLRHHPDIRLTFVKAGEAIPCSATLVILPGSKSTFQDLDFVRANGWDIDLAAHIRRGGHVLGICGGYQMLGRTLTDLDGVDGPAGTMQGLGHLDIETCMRQNKHVTLTRARALELNSVFEAYEIHMGKTWGVDCGRPFAMTRATHHEWQNEGARSASGQVCGTYLHGLFLDDAFREHYLESVGLTSTRTGPRPYHFSGMVDQALDRLAGAIDQHVDMDRLRAVMDEAGSGPDS
ncbi:MAG: cobyric acid synthase [Rhodobacteraceae bacterium]|nr:cobyric acid synthase [Paracoccaceae bacterium]